MKIQHSISKQEIKDKHKSEFEKYRNYMTELGFPCGSAGKECACNVGDLRSIPGLRRSPGEGKVYPLQHSGLGEFHELYSPQGCKELDTTKQLSLSHFHDRTKELEITNKIILEMKMQLEEAIDTVQSIIQKRGGKG